MLNSVSVAIYILSRSPRSARSRIGHQVLKSKMAWQHLYGGENRTNLDLIPIEYCPDLGIAVVYIQTKMKMRPVKVHYLGLLYRPISKSIWEWVPNVEDRLPLLIQKQLDAIIRRHPPLFPWETKLEEYETNENESGHPKPSIPTPSPEPSSDS